MQDEPTQPPPHTWPFCQRCHRLTGGTAGGTAGSAKLCPDCQEAIAREQKGEVVIYRLELDSYGDGPSLHFRGWPTQQQIDQALKDQRITYPNFTRNAKQRNLQALDTIETQPPSPPNENAEPGDPHSVTKPTNPTNPAPTEPGWYWVKRTDYPNWELAHFTPPTYLQPADYKTRGIETVTHWSQRVEPPQSTQPKSPKSPPGWQPIYCKGCGNEIDPDLCHCGIEIKKHTYHDGHAPVPMGCTCGYAKDPKDPKDPKDTPTPVCKTCKDTHIMTIGNEMTGTKEVMCTHCPIPCDKCKEGPYCKTTPCPCDCHKKTQTQLIQEERKISKQIGRIMQ